MAIRILRRVALVAVLPLVGCTADRATAPTSNEKPALAIAFGGGDAQGGVVGAPLTRPIVVQVTGVARPDGQIINFVVTSGGGAVFSPVVESGTPKSGPWKGMHGIAQDTWTLGPQAGPQHVEARLVDPTTGATLTQASFNATATPATAAVLARAAGDRQTAIAGSPVAIPPAAVVTDQYGNPITGVPVAFAAATGSGSITGPATLNTGQTGTAAVGGWILGTTAGPNTLIATSAGLTGSPLTFTAAGTPGGAALLVLVSGDHQTAGPGATLPEKPTVRVVDANDNGIPNVAVTFTVTAGGGSIDGVGSVTTLTGTGTAILPAGAAAVNWTVGTGAGANTLRATAAGLNGSPLDFSAVTVVPPPFISSFDAAASTIPYGTGTTLTADFSGGDGVIDGLGAVTSGTPISTGLLITTTTFRLRVTNPAGMAAVGTVMVTVTAPQQLYVSSLGDDRNPGLADQPMKTISRALGLAVSGTAVFVGPGTYDDGNGEIFPLQLPAGVSLIGDEAGKGATTDIVGGGSIGELTAAIAMGANSVIAGFSISNGRGNTVLIQSGSVTVRNNRIHYSDGSGILMTTVAASDGLIAGNDIMYNRYGLQFYTGGGSATRVENNDLSNNLYGVVFAFAKGGDLGGGTAGSVGGNVLSCNRGNDLWGNVGTTIYAFDDFWDHVPPTEAVVEGTGDDIFAMGGGPQILSDGARLALNPCP